MFQASRTPLEPFVFPPPPGSVRRDPLSPGETNEMREHAATVENEAVTAKRKKAHRYNYQPSTTIPLSQLHAEELLGIKRAHKYTGYIGK